MKKQLLVLIALNFLLAGTAAAQTTADPGILPTNPFYFLKEWRRSIVRLFTFNPVAKANLELEIAEQKAAEAHKIQEVQPENIDAIKEALENYQSSQERLRDKLSSLKENSQNPDVDSLLDNITDHAVRHEKLFDELVERLEDRKEEIAEVISKTKEKIEEMAVEAAQKDEPAKFIAKLEKALIESEDGALKHLRSVELIDRINERAPEMLKESLERLRSDFSEKLEEDIEDLLDKTGSEILPEAAQQIPGDTARYLMILEEISAKTGKRTADIIDRAIKELEKQTAEDGNIAQRAKEQIERAKSAIQKTESRLAETENAPSAARQLLSSAKDNLKKAMSAMELQKYGEAFGQARSAESLAKNALRVLKEAEPEADDLEDINDELRELEAKIGKYEELLKSRGYTPESNPKEYALLNNARQHWGFAGGELEKNNLIGVKIHIGHVKGFLSDLARLLEITVRPPAEPVFCTQEYDPVCGADNKTYSNACSARATGARMLYKGECQTTSGEPSRTTTKPEPVAPSATVPPEPVKIEPEILLLRLDADDSGFYPSSNLTVKKGSKVKLEFTVRRENVYFGGLDFRSSKFQSATAKPGESVSVEFLANESFEFQSWWPASSVLKKTGRVVVE